VFQLSILSGDQAGTTQVAGRLPFWIGRSEQDDLRLVDPGVWERHARLELLDGARAGLSANGEALVLVNGQPVRQTPLRNGDVIELGAARLEFGLSPARHRSLRLREFIIWAGLALLCLGQVALIYWLAMLE
jgi:pSer/pThr/pTyr-binding forkhead associated (FHA) protein